jgi:CMP-N-acetylneuraminic acid synthetase
MRVLGLVPARGGARGAARGHARRLAGRPLLAYTAECAAGARSLTRVILSTEEEGIAEIGMACGLDVPFLRPTELSAGEAPLHAVADHALRWLEERGERWDAVCLLPPRHPLRRSEDVDACVALLEREDADAILSVAAVPDAYNPHWVYTRCDGGCLHLATGERVPIARRESLPPAYRREGSICVTRRDVIVKQKSLYGRSLLGHVVDSSRSLRLDTPEDWSRAETLLSGTAVEVGRAR